MAEFKFYGTEEDAWQILGVLNRLNRFSFISAKASQHPDPFRFDQIYSDLRSQILRQRHYFLWSKVYSLFPPRTTLSHNYWWIDEQESGPSLHLILPICLKRGDKLALRSGSLGHITIYKRPDSGERYTAPQSLKRAYKEMRALLCRGMKKRYWNWKWRFQQQDISEEPMDNIDVIWIAPHALELMEVEKAGICFGQSNFLGGESWHPAKDFFTTREQAIKGKKP